MTVSAADINTVLEGLADRTACLVPKVDVFTTVGESTWTKPANALFIELVLVGGGGGGGGGTGDLGANRGGGGGAAGQLRRVVLPASHVPDTLNVTVGNHGLGGTGADDNSGTDGTSGYTSRAVGSRTIGVWTSTFNLEALGGAYGVVGHSGGAGGAGVAGRSASGGAGTAAGDLSGNSGGAGEGGGASGIGRTDAGDGGRAGSGYGAGGGGGGAYNATGGGGAGGYGTGVASTEYPATPGAGAQWGQTSVPAGGNGGRGAQGVVVITSWCGVDLR